MSVKLTTVEACEYIGVCRKTYQIYIRQGRIKAQMEGCRWVVERAELNRFLKQQLALLPACALDGKAVRRKQKMVKELLALPHISGQDRSLVEDYAQECINLEQAVTSRERSAILSRKLKLADALLITPQALNRIKEVSEEIEIQRNINHFFMLALEFDPQLGPLFLSRQGEFAAAVSQLTRDFMDSGLDIETWDEEKREQAAEGSLSQAWEAKSYNYPDKKL